MRSGGCVRRCSRRWRSRPAAFGSR
jgi:hypothetical protein